jgi:hypothetical protein
VNPYRPWRIACFAVTLLAVLGTLAAIFLVVYRG